MKKQRIKKKNDVIGKSIPLLIFEKVNNGELQFDSTLLREIIKHENELIFELRP